IIALDQPYVRSGRVRSVNTFRVASRLTFVAHALVTGVAKPPSIFRAVRARVHMWRGAMGFAAAVSDLTSNTPDERELDALETLGDEIATLSAHIHAATYRLLVLIAEFDRRRGWESAGHANCAYWLAARTGIDLGAAREKVRASRALEVLPQTSAAMARGELSFSQVRALSRVATPENEADLLELARGATTAQLERVVRSWKK